MTTPTADPSWSPRDDVELSSIFDHVEAMLTATGTMARLAVLDSARRHGLLGLRVTCSRHRSGDMNFAELRRHAGKFDHEPGDVTPCGPDPRDLARQGERDDDQ